MVNFNKLCSNVVPTGTYKAQLTDLKFKTGNSGMPTHDLTATWTIAEGAYNGRTIMDTIRESAFSFRLKPLLSAAGVDMAREFATTDELLNYGIAQSKGKLMMIEVTVRTYNGNDYNNIKSVSPCAGSTTTASEVLAEFDTMPELQGDKPHIDEIGEQSTESASSLDIPDDDLPF